MSLAQVIGCDFLVSATGVEPRKTPFLRPEFAHQTSSHAGTCPQLDAEGYIVVDNELRTSISNVFAAGDCCHYPSEPFSAVGRVASHFFQMRLWSQVGPRLRWIRHGHHSTVLTSLSAMLTPV